MIYLVGIIFVLLFNFSVNVVMMTISAKAIHEYLEVTDDFYKMAFMVPCFIVLVACIEIYLDITEES